MPDAKVIGVLVNSQRPGVDAQLNALQATADKIACQLNVLKVANQSELEAAFTTLAQRPVDALLVGADPLFNDLRGQVISLAARHRVPAIYQWREFPAAGGMISYGPSLSDAYRQSGTYVGRILKGEKPADLPVSSRRASN